MQATLIHRLTDRPEWQFASVLPRAAPILAVVWWILLILRGLLPAGFAVAMGLLITAVQASGSLLGPLTLVGVVFVGLQTLSPLQGRVPVWQHRPAAAGTPGPRFATG